MRALQISLFILGIFALADAQNLAVITEKSTIKGTVMDIQGAVIPGTKVNFTGKSGKTYSTSTDAGGVFRLQVSVDIYRVEFLQFGFATYKVEGYRVGFKTPLQLDVVLNVAGPSGPVYVEEPKGAQTVDTSKLTGTVYDAYGAVIVKAKVRALAGDGRTFDTTTNEDGVYVLVLPFNKYSSGIGFKESKYDIIVESPGFRRSETKGFVFSPSQFGKMYLDLALEVGAISDHDFVIDNKK
jgi:hypothetical protein